MSGTPLLEEVKRSSSGSTFAISDEDAASFAIDAHKTLETFGGTGSFCCTGSLFHGFNNGAVMIENGAINKFCHIVNVRNCCGR